MTPSPPEARQTAILQRLAEGLPITTADAGYLAQKLAELRELQEKGHDAFQALIECGNKNRELQEALREIAEGQIYDAQAYAAKVLAASSEEPG